MFLDKLYKEMKNQIGKLKKIITTNQEEKIQRMTTETKKYANGLVKKKEKNLIFSDRN